MIKQKFQAIFGSKQNKPQKPFVSFAAFKQNIRFGYGQHKSKLRCQKCNGDGKIIHPDAKCDPVEGYKMAERIACQFCHGTGIASEIQAKDSYLEMLDRHQGRLAQWHKARKVLLPTLQKLNRKDFKLLGLPFMS